MAGAYILGYSGREVTRDEFISSPQVTKMEPEFARRIIGICDEAVASGKKVGIGESFRSSDVQKTVFLQRHYEDPNGSIWWDGKRWTRKAGMAPAAPPGSSFHEGFPTGNDTCLACDMVGDLIFINSIQSKWGVIDFGNVNKEPWHHQPVEIPKSRKGALASIVPLKRWNYPVQNDVIVPKPILKLGSRGDEVVLLRAHLSFFGFMKDNPKLKNAPFGTGMRNGVKRMQKKLGIKADGIYGPGTAAAWKKYLENL